MENTTFSNLGVSADILQAIREMGFEEPTSIQQECIPKILSGTDLVGQAQTGTGKTAAFGIPAIMKAAGAGSIPRVLVLCPTRELAIQVTGELIKLAKHTKGVFVVPVYGGQPISRQFSALKRGVQIVVGTPGRVIDHLKRGTLNLSELRMLVLDEADEMLNMGFREDIEQVLSHTKGTAQMVMFSATVPRQIRRLMEQFMQDPAMVKIEGQAETAANIEQYAMEVRDSMRTEAICRSLDMGDFRLALVFCNTKRACDQLVEELQSRGYAADALHGDMSQAVRDKVMKKFRSRQIEVLVATDVAARGLDVDDVEIVFNYDIPADPEFYVHRIGRTARAGRSGMAVTFVSGRKNKRIQQIEKMIRTKLIRMSMPTVKDVREVQKGANIQTIVETLQAGGLREYIDLLEPIAEGDFTPIEIAAALYKLKYGHVK